MELAKHAATIHAAGSNPCNYFAAFHDFRRDGCCWPQSWACQRQQLGSGLKRLISCASFCKGLCNPFVSTCWMCASKYTHVCSRVCSEFAHVRSAAESALAKLYSKIVILDLQKSIFFRPAGAVQRGSVCTLSLIELVQCVSERSPYGVRTTLGFRNVKSHHASMHTVLRRPGSARGPITALYSSDSDQRRE